MTRAFVKESEDSGAELELPERSVSPHRNLVTPNGLRLIEAELRRLNEELASARATDDKPALARCQRDLRYWTQRRATAELVQPSGRNDKVRFGSTVTLRQSDGTLLTLRIVGEDEADPAAGTIAYVAPVAAEMIGASVGERIRGAGGDRAIVTIA